MTMYLPNPSVHPALSDPVELLDELLPMADEGHGETGPSSNGEIHPPDSSARRPGSTSRGGPVTTSRSSLRLTAATVRTCVRSSTISLPRSLGTDENPSGGTDGRRRAHLEYDTPQTE